MSVFKLVSYALLLIFVIKALLAYLPAVLVFLALCGAFLLYQEYQRNRKP